MLPPSPGDIPDLCKGIGTSKVSTLGPVVSFLRVVVSVFLGLGFTISLRDISSPVLTLIVTCTSLYPIILSLKPIISTLEHLNQLYIQ